MILFRRLRTGGNLRNPLVSVSGNTRLPQRKRRYPPCIRYVNATVNEIFRPVNVAVFSFASLSDLRSSHKVRGDPVVEGVCAMFGSLLNCANKRTVSTFREVSASRLGGWCPGQEPSRELKTWVSSRLKLAKTKVLRARGNPQVRGLLAEKEEPWEKEKECVETKYHLAVGDASVDVSIAGLNRRKCR